MSILTIPAVAAFLVLSDVLITGLFRSAHFWILMRLQRPWLNGLCAWLASLCWVETDTSSSLCYGSWPVRPSNILCVSGSEYCPKPCFDADLPACGSALATSLVSWLALIWQAGWLVRAGRLNGKATKVILKAGLAAV